MHRQRCRYVLGTMLVVMIVGACGGDRPVLVAQALAATGWERQPQARAGEDLFISILEPIHDVTLDGSGSTAAAPGDTLWFRWTFTSFPGPTPPLLSNPFVPNPTFTPEVAGQYELSLTVKDGRGRMASDGVAVNAQAPRNQVPQPCNCRGSPGDVIDLAVQVTDAEGTAGIGVPRWRVVFTVEEGTGVLVGESPDEPGSVTILTDDNGFAAAQYILGGEERQLVIARAQNVDIQAEFDISVPGPLAGNGIEPVNIAVGGNVVYTVNVGTNNISALNIAKRSVGAVISFTGEASELIGVRTENGGGTVLGATASAVAKRLYVYGVVAASQGQVVVLLAVDTETNKLATLADPEGDGLPGLSLSTLPYGSPALDALSPQQILGLEFGNLVTVDEELGRIYAVVPGVVEGVSVDNQFSPVNVADGELIIIDAQTDDLQRLSSVPVGQVPTGVAVNTRTNRIYVTNRGLLGNDDADDTVTVIDGSNLTVLDTITVGRGPLGVKLDEVNNVIYVSNLFGKAALGCCGAVSVINGQTNAVIQTIPTGGTTDLAVLVGAETPLLADELDRIYAGHESKSTVIECDVTDLTAPESCQLRPDLPGLAGKLAINESNTLLFGARRYDKAVEVLDLATAEQGEIETGAAIRGVGPR
jgi:YVTN family beta-propeller protein